MIRELGLHFDPRYKSRRYLVEFSLKGHFNARNVYVVGDFCHWFPGAFPMIREEDWKIVLPFYPGEYRYAYVINGYRWKADPDNFQRTKNEYGMECCVAHVGGEILAKKCRRGDGQIELNGLYHDQTWHFLHAEDGVAYIKFRAKRDDLTKVFLVIEGPSKHMEVEMHKLWSDKYFDYYEASYEYERMPVKYFFKAVDAEKVVYYSSSGPSNDLKSVKAFEISEKLSFFEVPEWVKGAVFYQIFPERFYNGDPTNDPPNVCKWGGKPTRDNFFGGDLKGILDKLDYLQELGVDIIYFTPIFCSKSNHKYDIYDYYRVDPSFGTNDLLKKLVQEAHKRGIRIILDAVFNHTSNEFPAFQDVVRYCRKSRYKDWYFILKYPPKVTLLHKVLYKLPLPRKVKSKLMTRFHPPYETFAGVYRMPKLNMLNSETAEYFLKVAEYWVKEFGIDGWRFDVAFGIPLGFWKKLRQKLKGINSEVYLMAEFGDNFSDPTEWIGGESFDAIMNYPLRSAILDFVVFEKIKAEEFHNRIMRLMTKIPRGALLAMYNLLGSHDTPRLLTLCKGDIKKVKLAIFLQMTLPGAPAIYYGDEVGMEGKGDPDCRRTMRWNRKEWKMEIFKHYRTLIKVRKGCEALKKGEFKGIVTNNENLYAFLRKSGNETVLAIVNVGDKDTSLSMNIEGTFLEVFSEVELKPQEGVLQINVPAKSALLLLPLRKK